MDTKVSLDGIDEVRAFFTGIDGRLHERPEVVWDNEIGAMATDGSSFHMRPISRSDLRVEPDWDSKRIDQDEKAMLVFCDLMDSEGKIIPESPRGLLKRVLHEAEEKGYTFMVGPEMEFFLLPLENGVPLRKFSDSGWYYGPRGKQIRAMFSKCRKKLKDFNIEVLANGHHEVAKGQYEISFKFGDALTVADNVELLKLTVKEIAEEFGFYPTFMAKPFPKVNGSGMHVHQSLWTPGEGGENLFASPEEGLSDLAKSFIAGQIFLARGLAAAIAPTVNSYKRLVPGYEAPVYGCWSKTNRSAMIRIPDTDGSQKASRIELRCADPSSNPYVAFAAMLTAGLYGVEGGLKAPAPVDDINVYEMSKEEREKLGIQALPGSLGEAVDAFKKEEFLMERFGGFAPLYLGLLSRDVEEFKLDVSDLEFERYHTR